MTNVAVNGRTLYVGGHVYAPGFPFATAVFIDGDTIAWVGDDVAAGAYRDLADTVVDCDGAFIAPGFVDAHVHATASGMAITGLDLTGYTRRVDVIEALSHWARESGGATIIGHGWDETRWDDPRPLHREEIDRATWGSVVFLSRVDVHSALVSSALIAAMPELQTLAGFDPSGWLRDVAVARARSSVFASIAPAQRKRAQQAFLDRASQCGIVAVHEMAGPSLSSVADARSLMELSQAGLGPDVSVYWGELASADAVERAHQIGVVGLGGDLFVDGSLGSRTALLREPYHDDPLTMGVQALSAHEVAEHVVAVTECGLQAGFHVIGDGAMALVVEGLMQAASHCGVDAMRRSRHRLEHAEMLDTASRAVLRDLGVTVSMQPMFDALWGGAGRMYAERLGEERASSMNAFAAIAADGLLMAFGSDSPVTPIGPWQAVHAAMAHPHAAISARASFHAHTRAGWRAIGRDDAGAIAPGSPAHLALWRVAGYRDEPPDDRVSRWSTDPRSGTPDLPDLDLGIPECLRTVVHGRVVWDRGELS